MGRAGATGPWWILWPPSPGMATRFCHTSPLNMFPAAVLRTSKTTFILILAHVCLTTSWTLYVTYDRQLAYKVYFTKKCAFLFFLRIL